MKTRAEKFIEEHMNGILQFALPFPKSWLAEHLEQFHKECMPTDEEIKTKLSLQFVEGVCFCRDFVREEPKKIKACINCKYQDADKSPCNKCRNYRMWKKRKNPN